MLGGLRGSWQEQGASRGSPRGQTKVLWSLKLSQFGVWEAWPGPLLFLVRLLTAGPLMSPALVSSDPTSEGQKTAPQASPVPVGPWC